MKRGQENQDVIEAGLILHKSVSEESDRLFAILKQQLNAVDKIEKYLENDDLSEEQRDEYTKKLDNAKEKVEETIRLLGEEPLRRNRVPEFEKENERLRREAESIRRHLREEEEAEAEARGDYLLEEAIDALNQHRKAFAERYMKSRPWDEEYANELYRKAVQLVHSYRTIELKEKAVKQLKDDLQEVTSESTTHEEGSEIVGEQEGPELVIEPDEREKEWQIIHEHNEDIIIEEPIVSLDNQLGGREVRVSKEEVRRILLDGRELGELTDDLINGFMLALRKTLSKQTRDLWFFFPVQFSRVLLEETITERNN
jgi:hypothetical protein